MFHPFVHLGLVWRLTTEELNLEELLIYLVLTGLHGFTRVVMK